MDKWIKLRDLRNQNQMVLYNHFLPYSSIFYIQFDKFLTDLINKDLENAIQQLESIQKWSEDRLKDEWSSLGRRDQIESIFSSKEWNLIQSTFEANAGKLANLKEVSPKLHKPIFNVIRWFIDYLQEGENTTKKIFKLFIKKFKILLEDHMNVMGELAAKSLYGKICLGIVHYGEFPPIMRNKKGKVPIDTKSILKDLWKGLKESDDQKSLVYVKKLRKGGEQNAIYYTRHISDLRYQRIHQSNNIEKLELLMKEHEFTTEMRRNGLYYSIGLYFQNVLELSLTGSDKIIKGEYKKAKELSFESIEETSEVTIRELLDNPDKYDGKTVKVSGLVANIKETKLNKVKGELVFITFELVQDGYSMEFYFPRNWLTDNGLKEEGFAEFTGTFNKMCPKSKKPDIHVIRLGPGKRKNDDWVSRCKWLVHEWWDGYTGRATANWTLSTLTPASDVLDGEPLSDIRELAKKYPSIRAGFEALKSVMFDRIRLKLDIKYGGFLFFLYLRYTMIDLIVYLTLMSIIKEKIIINFPFVRWYPTEPPWGDVIALGMCKIERPELELGEDINWFIYEQEWFFKEVEVKKLDVGIKYAGAGDWEMPGSAQDWQDAQDMMDYIQAETAYYQGQIAAAQARAAFAEKEKEHADKAHD